MAEFGFGVDIGGTTIKLGLFGVEGVLLDKKAIDEDGKEYRTDYRVTFVSRHGVDDNYEETLEGKKKRIEDEQPTLFDEMDF